MMNPELSGGINERRYESECGFNDGTSGSLTVPLFSMIEWGYARMLLLFVQSVFVLCVLVLLRCSSVAQQSRVGDLVFYDDEANAVQMNCLVPRRDTWYDWPPGMEMVLEAVLRDVSMTTAMVVAASGVTP